MVELYLLYTLKWSHFPLRNHNKKSYPEPGIELANPNRQQVVLRGPPLLELHTINTTVLAPRATSQCNVVLERGEKMKYTSHPKIPYYKTQTYYSGQEKSFEKYYLNYLPLVNDRTTKYQRKK